MNRFAQTATIAASTAALTSAAILATQSSDQPTLADDKSSLTTSGLFGGTLLAPGMTDKVAMDSFGTAPGVAGTITTVERAALFTNNRHDSTFDYGTPVVIGVAETVEFPYGNLDTAHGYPINRDGSLTSLTVVSNEQPNRDDSTYEVSVRVNGTVAAGPFVIDQCSGQDVFTFALADIPVSAGDQLTILLPTEPIACETNNGFNSPKLGPFIIDIEREVEVTPGVPGDVNGDGTVNFADLVATLSLFTQGNRAV